MRWYVVVEGRETEKRVYRAWIEHAFARARRVLRIEDMAEDGYFILVGNGYPSYERRIRNAIEDIRASGDAFDHLMICVDAEELSVEERRSTIEEIVIGDACPAPYTIVVHDCCVETWFLGNRKFAKRDPEGERLRQYYEFFDVRAEDPEALPAMVPGTPRAAFHLDYLRQMFQERKLSYSKQRPSAVREPAYLNELARRAQESEHLRSFHALLCRWRELGGEI